MGMTELIDIQSGMEAGFARLERTRPAPDPERDERVARTTADIWEFRREYLAEYFSDAPAPYHAEVDKAIDEHELIGVCEPREHGKTTRNTRSRALKGAATGQVPYTIIVRRSEADVKASVLWLREQFESNGALRRDYGDLTGGQPWSDSEFVLANGCKVEGLTMGEPILGKLWGPTRPNAVYVDDPQTMQDVASDAIRETHRDWLQHQAIPALAQGGKLVLNQNMIHEDCLIAYAKTNSMFFTRDYDAILAGPKHQALWDKWEAIYREEDDPDHNRHERADRFYARNEVKMLEGVRLLWSGHWTYRRLMQRKIAIGEIVFWTQFRNKPYTGDKAKWLAWASPSDVAPRTQRIEGFDLASSQRATAAKFARVQIAIDSRGCITVTEAYEDRVGFGQQLLLVTEKPHPSLTARVIETNQYQAVLADTGKEQSLAGGAMIVSHHTSLPPELRAMKIWRLMENGKLRFVSTPAVAKLAQQACSYRIGHMPDLLSALELAIDHALGNAGGIAAFVLLGDVIPE